VSKRIESEIFDWLGFNIDSLEIYKTVFGATKPKKIEDTWYLTAFDQGISLNLNKKLCVTAVFLYAQGTEDGESVARAYQNALPAGLGFDFSRAKARKCLGEPTQSGEPNGEGIMQVFYAWDRYEFENGYLRLEYDDSKENIRMLTIGQL
jgi:hypothetical protein